MLHTAKPKKPHKLRLVVIILVILIIAGLGLFFWHQHMKKTAVIIPSTNPSVSSSTSKSKIYSSTPSLTASPVSNTQIGLQDKSLPSTNSGSTLIAPIDGGFISNDSPTLSGATIYQDENSVCNTTVGASCYIEFTKDGVTEQLAAETTDSQGSAYWSWNVNQAHLTAGTWTVTAVATLNGQTKSTVSQINLVVQP